MAVPSFTLLVLKTRQVEAELAFYQALGIPLVREQHGRGPIHFAGRLGELTFEIYPIADDEVAIDSATRLGFMVDDLSGVIERLKQSGSHVSSPPKETPWGFRAVVRDPDGLSVEIYDRRSPGA